MKIGIVTFHWSRNYGAALQTFALKKFLSTQNVNVSIINYNPNYKKKKKSINNIIKDNILKFLLMFDKKNDCKQKNSFNTFRKEYFNLTKDTKNELDYEQFDIIFCGSDQIWNPNLTGGSIDKHYFGLFENIKADFIFSYAASIGENELPISSTKDFSKYVSSLDKISVRERQIIDEVKKYCSKNIECVVDPTLLLEKKDYLAILNNSDMFEKPYLLIYQNSKNKDVYKIAKKIAKEKKLEIIEIAYRKQYPPTGIKTITYAGPKEFLNLYNNASFVVTNTFHGTVFAVQFEKNFVSIPLKGRESRVVNFANITGLQERLLFGYSDSSLENLMNLNIDYTAVKHRLEKEKNASKQYIYNCISQVKGVD